MGNFDKSISKINRAIAYLQNDVKTIMGVEAVNHFKKSFLDQGFTDTNLEKWQEVKRRDPASTWRGFQYGSSAPKPKAKRKSGSQTNFSPAAETRKILSGPSGQLKDGITYERTAKGVRVYASTVYSKLQNEGGPMKVFGRGGKTMPKRQFMGKSEVLRNRIRSIILKDLQNILK